MRCSAKPGSRSRDLDAIAFGRGPGGFTGLRIAAGVAQGLAAGARLPVVPVSNLAAIAAAAARETGAVRILACLDARMGEVYWAAYRMGRRRAAGVDRGTAVEAGGVLPPGRETWQGAGRVSPPIPKSPNALGQRLAGVDGELLPHAADIARLAALEFAAGRSVPAARALPVYLRNDVVHRR